MSDTYQAPREQQAPRRPTDRLVRPEARVLGGVAGAIARAVGAEVSTIRIVLVVLAFVSGGAIVPAYLAAWVLLPGEGEPAGTSITDRIRDLPTWVKVVAVISVLGAVGSIGSSGFGFGLLLLGVGWLLFREDERARTGTGSARSSTVHEPTAAGAGTGSSGPGSSEPSVGAVEAEEVAEGRATPAKAQETVDDPLWDGFPWTLPPELRDDDEMPIAPSAPARVTNRPVLGRLTLGLSLVGLALTGLLDRIGLVVPDFQDYLAVVVICCGVGLLVGVRRGRSRGLLVVALLLGLLLLIPDGRSTGFRGLSGGIGERTVTPTTAAEAAQGYELGVGQQTIDLTEVDLDALDRPLQVDARQGVGEMIVIVPDDVTVELQAKARAGDIEYFGEATSGDGQSVDETFRADDEGAPTLMLDLTMGLGQISVEREGGE